MFEVSISNQIRLSYSCMDCGADSEEDMQIRNTSIGCLGDGTGLLFLTLLSRQPLPEKQVFLVTVADDIMAEATLYTDEPELIPEQEPVESRNSELYNNYCAINFLSAKF